MCVRVAHHSIHLAPVVKPRGDNEEDKFKIICIPQASVIPRLDRGIQVIVKLSLLKIPPGGRGFFIRRNHWTLRRASLRRGPRFQSEATGFLMPCVRMIYILFPGRHQH